MFVRAPALLLLSLGLSALPAHADETRLEQQRAAFRAVYPAVERGEWQPVVDRRDLLDDYILWPDLRATYYRARMRTADHDEVGRFLDRFGTLKPARELRYRFALHLAETRRFDEYLQIYERFYRELDVAKLDCLALQAELAAGRGERIVDRALALWRVGHSQEDECDPVFAHLRDISALDATQYAARFELAVDAERFSLARYLARSLDASYREQAERWIEAARQPLAFIARSNDLRDDELTRRQLAYAIERLAYDDPDPAHEHWQALERRFRFDAAAVDKLDRHIALWTARLHLPSARDRLAALADDATDAETGRWQVRAAMLVHDWPAAAAAIAALPDPERDKPEWRYWAAIAARESGDDVRAILDALAAERGYYGFLAADALGRDYNFEQDSLQADETLLARLVQDSGLQRARELFHVGLEGRGRSEWDSVMRELGRDEQVQAAILAHRWGWHSRAIATAADSGEFDDLEVRYPLPWRGEFSRHAQDAGIGDGWAYGVARSESLFMRDIRSSAGAVGIMQLMPSTGRRTARAINLRYAGLATLTDVESNIRLGTHYLGEMSSRFGANRVLATAAYNAGPLRVEAWLPDKGSLDARIWIENIPYNETRSYVKRVLADEIIFQWRLGGNIRRLSDVLTDVVASAGEPATLTTD